MSTPPHNDKRPLSANTPLFVTMLVLLAVSMVFLFTIPFVVPALIYLIKLRDETTQSASSVVALQSEVRYNNYIRAEVDRLKVMDNVQRQEEIASLDWQIEERRMQLDSEIEAARRQWDSESQRSVASKAEAERKLAALQSNFEELQEKVLDLKDIYDVQDYGLYDFENPAEDSVKLGVELKTIQARIKDAVKAKRATTSATGWTLNNSAAQGKKMVNDMSKLLLRAFNSEAENAVKTVRAGHLSAALKRLDRSAEAVERLGKMMNIKITGEYAMLRKEELRVTHKHLEALKAAKEEEREIRRREREEAKAQKEFEQLKVRQQKEVEHYRNVVAALRASGDVQEAEKMTAALHDAEDKLEDVERTMANTKAGYVYVASNRGAFGEGIVKIGMTRRLNPEERLKELSDASVPFNFDKHTIIFSEDAVSLENALHRHFASVRVNLINRRREYFYARPIEVKEALIAHDVQVLEYHELAEAVEFEASESQRKQRAVGRA